MILDKDFSFKKMGRKSLKKSTGSIMGNWFNKSREFNLLNADGVKKDQFLRT